MFEADRDFSQYGEQQLILTYVRGHPDLPRFSVDAGAFDGVTGSNTRALGDAFNIAGSVPGSI